MTEKEEDEELLEQSRTSRSLTRFSASPSCTGGKQLTLLSILYIFF